MLKSKLILAFLIAGFFMIPVISAIGLCKHRNLVCRQPDNKLEKQKNAIKYCNVKRYGRYRCRQCEFGYFLIDLCRSKFNLPNTLEAFEES